MKFRKPSILVVNWVSSCLSFFLSASTAATYIFSALPYTITIISLQPCALNADFEHFLLSCSISYWDLIKCPYFADTTERGDRGWKEVQRQGEDKVTLQITLLYHLEIWIKLVFSALSVWVNDGRIHGNNLNALLAIFVWGFATRSYSWVLSKWCVRRSFEA